MVRLSIVKARRIRAFENPDAHQYHKNFHGAVLEPPKTFYVMNTYVPFSFTDSTNQCKALNVILNRSNADSFLGGSGRAPWKLY